MPGVSSYQLRQPLGDRLKTVEFYPFVLGSTKLLCCIQVVRGGERRKRRWGLKSTEAVAKLNKRNIFVSAHKVLS